MTAKVFLSKPMKDYMNETYPFLLDFMLDKIFSNARVMEVDKVVMTEEGVHTAIKIKLVVVDEVVALFHDIPSELPYHAYNGNVCWYVIHG